MTFQINRNVLGTIFRINAGWMIWAGSVIVSHFVVLAACDTHSTARIAGVPTLLILVGAIAAAICAGFVYRITSTARKHWAADAPRSDLAVDYLAATVAVLSMLGIVLTTISDPPRTCVRHEATISAR